jgi:hypothetical protein
MLRDGTGCRKDPYRYRLPGMEQKWHEKSLERLMKLLEWKSGSCPAPKFSPLRVVLFQGLTMTSPVGPRNSISKRLSTSRPKIRSWPAKSA